MTKPFICKIPVSRFFQSNQFRGWLALAIGIVSLAQPASANGTQATGGNVVHAYRDAEGLLWQVLVFTDLGPQKLNVAQGGELEYLVVAGGGAGGSSSDQSGGGASGGGGGGVVIGTKSVQAGTYEVVVGAGGEPINQPGATGLNGGNSSAFGLVALGGGGGGGAEKSVGADGGSGGGGGRLRAEGGKALQPASEAGGLGHAGATGARTGPDQGSGGGGAGGGGQVGSFRNAGAGGKGLVSMITGKPVTYAAGGRGGFRAQTLQGAPGMMNRGEGGAGAAGGRGRSGWAIGGPGGSGVVIVRYQLPSPPPMLAEGGAVTTYKDDQGKPWRVHTFSADGQLKIVKSGFVEALLVGGGGGGATTTHGKPGPGGVGGQVVPGGRYVSAGETYNIFVGIGGKGAPLSGRGTPGMDGDPSSVFGFSAGGGRGGDPVSAGETGGRGAGGDAADANGGPGLVSSISGTERYYGGGGGTALADGMAGRGAHGGGDARTDGSPGNTGESNGGGGGGGSNLNFAGGGDGGSGGVIIRYPTSENPGQ